MATDANKKTLSTGVLSGILIKIKTWVLTILPDEIASRMPSKLPSPNAVTFTGGSTATYDGSKAVTVNIPSITVEGNTISFGDVKIGVD